ncbi:hypothetical protein BT69DRAFT_1345898 [Atractiella rhizophila]|nr:hypothetical protein BT69DRAFT_1345898 [Atractiella rhizophila]
MFPSDRSGALAAEGPDAGRAGGVDTEGVGGVVDVEVLFAVAMDVEEGLEEGAAGDAAGATEAVEQLDGNGRGVLPFDVAAEASTMDCDLLPFSHFLFDGTLIDGMLSAPRSNDMPNVRRLHGSQRGHSFIKSKEVCIKTVGASAWSRHSSSNGDNDNDLDNGRTIRQRAPTYPYGAKPMANNSARQETLANDLVSLRILTSDGTGQTRLVDQETKLPVVLVSFPSHARTMLWRCPRAECKRSFSCSYIVQHLLDKKCHRNTCHTFLRVGGLKSGLIFKDEDGISYKANEKFFWALASAMAGFEIEPREVFAKNQRFQDMILGAKQLTCSKRGQDNLVMRKPRKRTLVAEDLSESSKRELEKLISSTTPQPFGEDEDEVIFLGSTPPTATPAKTSTTTRAATLTITSTSTPMLTPTFTINHTKQESYDCEKEELLKFVQFTVQANTIAGVSADAFVTKLLEDDFNLATLRRLADLDNDSTMRRVWKGCGLDVKLSHHLLLNKALADMRAIQD